jgi:hypothetical protein
MWLLEAKMLGCLASRHVLLLIQEVEHVAEKCLALPITPP